MLRRNRVQGDETPLSWPEFKTFLWKSLGDSRSFVDTIWSRIRWDSQYQHKEVQDWASHLKHLQFIFIEFDADGAPEESTLICLFREELKPSIQAQMEQRGRENDNWEELIEKAIDAKAKVGLQPSSYVRDMDQRCPRGNRPSHTTTAKSQASATKDHRDKPSDKHKASDKPSRSLRSEIGEVSNKKDWKEKKKKYRRDQARKSSGSNSATGVNTTNVNHGWGSQDLSQITYYNCNKRGHYANKCKEPWKKNAAKKLATVLATSASVTEASEKETPLERFPCLWYPVRFRKNHAEDVSALIDSGSEVNAMSSAYAKKLGLRIRPTNVGAQKIDRSHLDTFGIVIAGFSLQDKLGKVRFFQETFLVADTRMEVVLGMPFLTVSSANLRFAEKELVWRAYSAVEALPTTQRVEIIGKKEFATVALDEEDETFVVHMAATSVRAASNVYPSQQAQIASLEVEEITIPSEYANYTDVFSPDSAAELPKHIGINHHPIDLINDTQPPYDPIYNLEPGELETLKTYIETNLANGFIRPSKLPAKAPILFIRKKDGSLRLCVDYRGLNNLTIKNRYPLPLIGESLDRLGRAKRFTQLDLTNAYHQMQIREGDEWKTAFRTWYGHFEYQVMPFGLSNALATFQGYVNKILAEKLNVFVIIYLDNILIYTEDLGQSHVDAVRWVLENLRRHSLFANLKKCRFYQSEVCFLGYVVSTQGVSMEEERIEAVKN